jgi:hypothetical protein
MKKIFTSILFAITGSIAIKAQTNIFPATGSTGIGTASPNASALLEVKSTTKGILIPRMTLVQRNAITAQATGLLIYQTNNTQGFYYYDGSVWKSIASAAGTTGGWSLTGNAGTTTSNYLGTSDKKSLKIKTSNISRLIIDSLGKVGIGTSAPGSLSEVHNGVLTVVNSNFSGNNSASVIINANTDVNGNSTQVLYKDQGTPKWALGGGNIGNAGANDFGLLNYTAALNAFTVLSVNNNVGIGTATPTNKLHVFAGSAGVTGYGSAPLVVENATHCFINMIAPDNYETGILFGKPQNIGSGEIIYNNASNLNGFQFRTNGGMTQMVLTSEGHVGIGTTDPGVFPLRIKSGADHGGIDIKDIGIRGLVDDWNLNVISFIEVGQFPLELRANDVYVGQFSSRDGSYNHISDKRLKTNINPMGNMLEKINQLKPCIYQYKNAISKQEYNGFIAQDVMKIFPDFVMHTISTAPKTDAYSLNYDGFGVIAIKGLQELLTTYTEQNEKITLLKKKADELEKAVAKIKANKQ